MIFDMHIHEQTFSFDSFASLPNIIARAQKIGLDGICITDHDSNGMRKLLRERPELQEDFLVIVGAEILTHEGDIVVFGLEEIPDRKLHASELMKYVVDHGGVGIAAHPYRNNNRGLGDQIMTTPHLHGFEGLNGNSTLKENGEAVKVARELGIPFIGASDSHQDHTIGKYATRFLRSIHCEADLLEAIRNKQFEAVHYHEQRNTFLCGEELFQPLTTEIAV